MSFAGNQEINTRDIAVTLCHSEISLIQVGTINQGSLIL
jgi:hypothetical protein